jgi:hypothetical protein
LTAALASRARSHAILRIGRPETPARSPTRQPLASYGRNRYIFVVSSGCS